MSTFRDQAGQPQDMFVRQAVATIALFVLSHAAVITAFILLLRRHMGGGLIASGAVFIHLAAVVGFILLLLDFGRRGFGTARPEGAIAIGGLAGMVLPFGGLVLGGWTVALAGAVAAAGLPSLVAAARARPGQAAIAVVTGLASGAILSITLNGEIYGHVFALEFTKLGWQAADPVFHPAIAALIANYGVPTTGVDGTPPIFYHLLSHFLAAAMIGETGEKASLVYMALQQILFVPAILLASALAVASFARFREGIAAVAPVAVVLGWHVYDWLGAYNSFFLSESYAMSLALFIFGLPLALAGPRDANIAGLLKWAVAVSLVAAVSIGAKYTLAYAWIIVGAYGGWRVTRGQHPRLALAVLVAAGAAYCAFLFLMYRQMGGAAAIEPFAYARKLPVSFWVSILYCSTGIAAAFVFRRRTGDGPTAALLILLTALLHLPDQFLSDSGAGEYYWFNPADHVAMLAAIALVSIAAMDWLPMRRVPIVAAAALMVAALGVVATNPLFVRYAHTVSNTLTAFDRLALLERPPQAEFVKDYRSHELGRQVLAPDLAAAWTQSGLRGLLSAIRSIAAHVARGVPGNVSEVIDRGDLASVVRSIETSLATVDAPRPGLYVGPENGWYWNGPGVCISRNFAFQSLTGVALLAGLPDPNDNCPPVDGYGMSTYDSTSQVSSIKPETLCSAAAERNLSPILVVHGPGRPVDIMCR